MVDQHCAWPRGKALGGSTIINYMINTRGNKKDYDQWAAAGNPGWSYKDVLPYFIKAEDSHLAQQDEGYHGRGGYLTISDVRWKSQTAQRFLEAAEELGNDILDYNGKEQAGFSYVQGTIRDSLRCSVEKAYLRPARFRDNLNIHTRSTVTKVIMNEDGLEAQGVEFLKDNKTYRIRARKEVILSAGALNSPQLLMLSGIGPKQHLNSLSIKLLKDLPVGETLYDHMSFPGLIFSTNTTRPTQNETILDFIFNTSGLLTTLGGVEALGYIKTTNSQQPDIELISLNTDSKRLLERNLRYSNNIFAVPLVGDFAIVPILLYPKSKGRLELRSKNPFDPPKFYGGTFTDRNNEDLRKLIAGIRYVQTFENTTAFKKMNAKLSEMKLSGCGGFVYDSDEYWMCALRYLATSIYHPIATCKMGPEPAVVDANLKVYGVKKLRIVDTSIIPLPLAAHTNVPAIMIGEKASDIIKYEWLL